MSMDYDEQDFYSEDTELMELLNTLEEGLVLS